MDNIYYNLWRMSAKITALGLAALMMVANADVSSFSQDIKVPDATDSAPLDGDGQLIPGNAFSADGATYLYGCGGPGVDTDCDGVIDSVDNCILVANLDQLDSDDDPDGHGDVCDFDWNNDCLVNFLDIPQFSGAWGAMIGDTNFRAWLDYNNDGVINFLDLGTPEFNFVGAFLAPPGPSAPPSDCGSSF